jgi:hypothetical protein
MQCNITFDFDSPEDRAHHLRCTKALDLALCLNEFKTQLLSQLKYDELTGKEKILLSNVNELLQDTMEEYGIDLDTLLT